MFYYFYYLKISLKTHNNKLSFKKIFTHRRNRFDKRQICEQDRTWKQAGLFFLRIFFQEFYNKHLVHYPTRK